MLAQTLIEPDEARVAAAAEMLAGSPGLSESPVPSAPIEPTWRDIWLTVTPIWIVLSFSRVLFYGLERLRFPEIVPPVWADAVQAIVLWPLVTLCCAIVLRRWVRSGWRLALLVALGTTLVIGFVARPAYAFGALLNSGNNVESQAWLTTFVSGQPQSWYPWLSNAVEYGVLYLSCVVAAVGFLTYRTLMHERLHLSRVEAAAAHERLRTLRSQLNPHFLFNALNSIVGLSDNQGALTQQVITQLSDLLRRTLRASELEVHGLTEELSHVDSYLQIQQVRQPSRIDWRVNLDLQSINTPVPSLILLPLVENAITHGLRGSARVEIEVATQCCAEFLQITVRNTCRDLALVQGAGCAGLGLRNVRERLNVLFGGRASLTAGRPERGHYEVRIRLPLRHDAGSLFQIYRESA